MATEYSRAKQTETTQVGDRFVIFDRDSLKSLVLNPTGARIWNMLCQSQTIDELVTKLVSRFTNLASEKASNDVATYLQELVTQGVVVVRE